LSAGQEVKCGVNLEFRAKKVIKISKNIKAEFKKADKILEDGAEAPGANDQERGPTMALTLNHNMMAYDTHHRLGLTYARLSQNTERLASGLRINSPVDGPTAFAVREMMRTDMKTMQQGLRNAADGISLLQTAEGAMAVIDEKLFRMKELAEQAATGTYTTVQREIINSEYQAMAAEIDRIANATEFNGVKLLDGSISDLHRGLGLKIHFGLTNSEAEDYNFVYIGDVRATTATGLRVAGDAHNDIWNNARYTENIVAGACCGGGVTSLSEPVDGWRAGDVFSFGYNWDMGVTNEDSLSRGRYIAGAWAADGEDFTLGQLLDQVNRGTQARVRVDIYNPAPRYMIRTESGRLLDVTAYPEEVGSICSRDLTVTGHIPVVMTTSAAPPEVCFGTSDSWPPADRFYYDAARQGWMTADGSAVSFTNFTAFALSIGVSPSYTVSGGDTINMSADASDGGAGLTWARSAGQWQWLDADGNSARVTARAEVQPVFALPDGQYVPAGLVEGNSRDGFRLKLGTPVHDVRGLTLEDLVEGDPEGQSFQWSFGNEVYFYGSASLVESRLPLGDFRLIPVNSGYITAVSALVAAINGNTESQFWARVESDPGYYRDGYTSIYVFCKDGGDSSCLEACDKALGVSGNARRIEDLVKWYNDEEDFSDDRGVVFNNGGKYWGVVKARPSGYGSWTLELAGRDLGTGRDLRILNMGPGLDLDLGTLAGLGFGLRLDGSPAENLGGLSAEGFVEVQNADDGNWDGAHLRTQSHAQAALVAITAAIERKEKIRTSLGSYMNRLENTMNHMEISMENLQKAESTISDVDVAREMIDFVKNQLLTQAGVSLLSQVNSLPQMALALLNG
jgi:flagellin-like hook-associated protein FlgL